MSRTATCKLLERAECGELSWEGIARECLQRMSEDEVKDMGEDMTWLEDPDDENW